MNFLHITSVPNDPIIGAIHDLETPAYSLWSISNFLFFVLVFAFFLVFMVRNRRRFVYLKNKFFIPIIALLGFVIYFIGFLEGGSSFQLLTLVLRSLTSSLRMFLLDSDLIEVRHAMHANELYMLSFTIIHFMAFVMSSLTLVQFFGANLYSSIRIHISFPSHTYLFVHANEASYVLAKDLLKHDPSRFIVLLKKRPKIFSIFNAHGGVAGTDDLLDRLTRLNVLIRHRNFSEQSTLKQSGLERVLLNQDAHMFLLSDDEDENVRFALAMMDEVLNHPKFNHELDIYVNLPKKDMSPIFYEKLLQAPTERLRVHLVNRVELCGRELIQKCDLTHLEKELLILGFGWVGQAALRNMIACAKKKSVELHTTVIDRNMAHIKEIFEHHNEDVQFLDINYVACSSDNFNCFELIKQKLPTLNQVVISLGDDEFNIETAIELHHYIIHHSDRKIAIYVHLDDDAKWSYLLTTNTHYQDIHFFGSYKSIFTEETILTQQAALIEAS